jgi:hypothetical protein
MCVLKLQLLLRDFLLFIWLRLIIRTRSGPKHSLADDVETSVNSECQGLQQWHTAVLSKYAVEPEIGLKI